MATPRRRASLLAISLVACGPKVGDADSMTESDADTQSADTSGQPTTDPPVTTGECPGAPATSTAGVDPRTDLSCPEHGQANTCCCFEDNGWRVNNVCEQHFPCPEIVVSFCSDGLGCDYGSPMIDCPDAVDPRRWPDRHAPVEDL
jgi:hypothetical protein